MAIDSTRALAQPGFQTRKFSLAGPFAQSCRRSRTAPSRQSTSFGARSGRGPGSEIVQFGRFCRPI